MVHFFIISIVFILQTHIVWAKSWNQAYKEVKEDIKLVENLKRQDFALKLRLFELYSEKFFLLVEKENEYELKVLDNRKFEKKLNQIRKIKKHDFDKIRVLAPQLLTRIKNPNIKSKIYYLIALHYEDLKQTQKYHQFLIQANENAIEERIKRKTLTRLAEFYYNDKKYALALRNYTALLKLPRDKWSAKHIFNMSWCYLKQGENDMALNLIVQSYYLNKKQKSINLGNQHIKSILFFFTTNNKSIDAITFLKKNKLNNFENLMQLIHYTFENGDKSQLAKIIKESENVNKTPKETISFLTTKVLIFRSLKKYRAIDKVFNEVKILNEKGLLEEDNKNELQNSLEGFLGYLQEIIKHPDFLKRKNKNTYLNLTNKNFEILALIFPKKAIYYHWMQGETYLAAISFNEAIDRYKQAILLAKSIKSLSKEQNQYLVEIFSSYFKAMESIENNKDKQYLSNIDFGYENYLYFFPNSDLSKEIYKRQIAFNNKVGNQKNNISILTNYNKNFPKDKLIQIGYFKSFINEAIKNKDIHTLENHLHLLANNFLGLKQSDYERVRDLSYRMRFQNIEQLELKSPNEAIAGYNKIFEDKNIEPIIKQKALEKILKLYDTNDFTKTSRWTSTYINFLNKSDYKNESKRIEYFIQKTCLRSDFLNCKKLIIQHFNKTRIRSEQFYSFLFESYIFLNEYDQAIRLLSILKKKNIANDFKNKKTALINSISILPQPSMLKWMKLLHSSLDFQKDIEQVITTYAENIYFYKNDPSIIENTNFSFLTKKRNQFRLSIDFINKIKNYPLLGLSKNEVSFESFSKELADSTEHISKYLELIDSFFKVGSPKFGSLVYYNGEKYMEKSSDIFRHYFPKTSELELSNAIKNELNKISKIYSIKAAKFNQLNIKLQEKLSDTTGSQKLFYQISGEIPWKNLSIIQSGY